MPLVHISSLAIGQLNGLALNECSSLLARALGAPKLKGSVPDKLKLVTLDLQGHSLHSVTVDYDAGGGLATPVMPHDGIWIGPNQTVLVDIPGTHLKAQPDSRDKVVVFSQDLTQLQVIDTDYHKIYGDNTPFKGVPQDRKAVIFWASDPAGSRERKCLLYTGSPLQQTGVCSLQELDAIDAQPQFSSAIVPKNYQLRAFPGSSMDGSRSSVFMVKESNSICELSGKLCPTSGKLIAFETATIESFLLANCP